MSERRRVVLHGSQLAHISHSQVMVYDRDTAQPGSLWAEQHVAQGFVRRETAVSFATLLECGEADVSVFSNAPRSLMEYARVVSVPITVESGILCIEGPDEYPTERHVTLHPGVYRVTLAQRAEFAQKMVFDLYLTTEGNPKPLSEILKAGEGISVRSEFLETGEVA